MKKNENILMIISFNLSKLKKIKKYTFLNKVKYSFLHTFWTSFKFDKKLWKIKNTKLWNSILDVVLSYFNNSKIFLFIPDRLFPIICYPIVILDKIIWKHLFTIISWRVILFSGSFIKARVIKSFNFGSTFLGNFSF